MSVIKIPREQCEFVTNEGILAFLFAFPGQAQPSFNAGSFAYKCEWSGDLYQNDPVIQAVTTVAQAHDPADWQRHVYGAKGRIKRLEEFTDRDKSKYQYAQNKFILGFSQVHTPASLGMKDANLADPAQRAKFDTLLAARAPGVVRFANPQNPADLQRIEQINNERMMQGQKPYAENEYHNVLLPLSSHEVWSGCYGRISGRAYWAANKKPATVLLALNHILLTRTGERLVGESSPDASFKGFAPSAALAPNPGYVQATQQMNPFQQPAPQNPWIQPQQQSQPSGPWQQPQQAPPPPPNPWQQPPPPPAQNGWGGMM